MLLLPSEDDSEHRVAIRNAAVSTAAGTLSCGSLWLLVHAFVRPGSVARQLHAVPWIVGVVGFALLLVTPAHSLLVGAGDDACMDGRSLKALRAVLWGGTALVAAAPVGGAWAASATGFHGMGMELLVSGLLLAIAACLFKFARII